jgi:hypothetical protein
MATQNIFDLTDTWNAGGTTFTAVKMNVTDTASASGSLLLDLQVASVSQASITKGGVLTTLGRAKINTLTVGLGGQTAVATNTALGFEALNSASLTGANNVAVGYTAGKALTSGSGNVAIGQNALAAATTSVDAVAIGRDALLSSSTGGTQNTAVGRAALRELTTGINATAVGAEALRRFVGGSNTALGNRALLGGNATVTNNTGTDNIGIGFQAGDVIEGGSRNTIIGNNSDPSAAAGVDQTVVGEGLTGKGDDTAFIGGTNGAYNEKNVTTWETTSDARIKKNIVSNGVGLEVISQIDVRNFEYRTAEEITELPASAAIDQPGIQLGVIAQELQAVLPGCVTENSTGVLSVNTDQLIWYLVNAVKQLSAEVQLLKGI